MPSPLTLVLPPVGITGMLWWNSPNDSELMAIWFAFLLLLAPWMSFVMWRDGSREGLPVFGLVGAAYWMYFGLPLLLGPRELALAGRAATYVPSESLVTETMALTFVGVVALWAGMRMPVSLWAPERLPDIVDTPRSWAYVRGVLLLGVTLGLFGGAPYFFGEGGRQVMVAFATIVPNVALVLLLRRHFTGRSTPHDRLALVVSGSALVVSALSSGWLGSLTSVLVLYGSVSLLSRRRIPWVSVLAVALCVLFLQVGKSEFRRLYWGEGSEGSIVERLEFWIGASTTRWRDAFEGGSGEDADSLVSESMQRLSLLPQATHVLDMTPADVPYQYGATYRYIAITFIPRFVWPDKPSVNEANRFYQVAYGMTTERDLASVSIAVGYLVEGFINFGWTGSLGIMFISGMILGLYERTFGVVRSSALFLAIGIALLPGFLAIESQFAQYFGGVVQQALMAALVFLPITKRRDFSGRLRSASGYGPSRQCTLPA